ncbi:hypothetical protein [Deefgea sp. CFH1-16]|uniref:hypothetical protein n=1 Tax=Deefgea sp. CFH1-16 TaxID=2675457 RepID=UPI0015F462D1|nr:hypothetical protein [Deefgea sp. CFH1-16]MBM5574155.1 hypothetical protein [Deefgea sp. CFH1-16]
MRLPAQRLQRGAYRVSHHLIADLPAGKYTAGFAFAELTAAGPRELAWHDVLCEFEVHYNTSQPFAGYAYLPAQMSVSPLYTPKNHLFKSHDPRLQHQVGVRSDAYLSSNGEAGFLMYGPYLALPAGRYQLRIHCECQNFIAAGARLDVVMASGAIELMACDQIDLDSAGCIVMPPITLDQPCNDLEVRIWVNEQTQLQIIQLEITPNYF